MQHGIENVAIVNALQGRPTPRQSFSALITTPLPSFKSLNLSLGVLSDFTADTLHYAVTLTVDLWVEHL